MNLNDAHKWTNKDGNVLILRGVGEDRTSHNGFKWPAVGETVTAEDWNDKPECGGGLHGWPWSFGVGEGRDICDIAHWQVCAAKPEDVIGNLENGCKCKFRTGTLVYEGDMAGAFALVRAGLEDFVRECAKNEESGDSSQSAQSGNFSKSESIGANSVIVAAGTSCTAKVGEFGVFALRWTDSEDHPRIAVGRVGVNGIKANVAYTVNSKGRIVKA